MRQHCWTAASSCYYEPQYSLAGHLCSLQAVLRLNHPQLGAVPASRFLPIAEECGLVVPIGNWVLARCAGRAWPGKISSFGRSVFPSGFLHCSFCRPDFAGHVLDTVTQCGLDPRWLELVVTEDTVMRSRTETAFQMRSLAAMGVHFSVGGLWQ